jgi:thioredoxin-related protein
LWGPVPAYCQLSTAHFILPTFNYLSTAKKVQMKKIVLLMALCITAGSLQAQTDTALYLRFPFVPPLNLYQLPDSTLFTKADLKKKKPLLLIIFSPDCDHCQQETRELTANIKRFSKIQIVMASWLPFAQVKQFYQEYGLANYPNITVGWDKAFMLPPYYKLQSLPFMALYDKRGQLITVFSGKVALDKVAEAFE